MLSIMPTSPGQYSSAGSSSSPTLSVEESRHVIRRSRRETTEAFYKKRKGDTTTTNKQETEAATKVQRLETYADDFESETDIECDVDDDDDRKSKIDNRKEDSDEHDVAFTILQDDDLEVEDKNVDVGDEGIGSTEELCVNHARKAKRASSGIFEADSSPESRESDTKLLSPANSSLLKAKLMALTQAQEQDNDQEDLAYTKKLIKSQEYLQKIHKSPDCLQDDLLYKKNTSQKVTKQFDRINNLSREKVLSQSNGNLHHQKTFILKKDYSQSYNNIEKRSDYSRYHQNCYVPGKMSTKSPCLGEQKINKTRGKRSVDPPTFNITTNNNKNVYNFKNQQYSLNNGLKSNARSRPLNNNNNSSKPVFVTTVKKGEFLEPPPDIAYLLGYGLSSSNSANGSNNSLNSGVRDRHQQQALFYSFSSQPRVLNQARSREKTPNKINNNNNSNLNNNNNNNNSHNNLNNSVKSCHQRSKRSTKADDEETNIPYGNLMYDRRVVRGSTIAQSSAAPWNPYFGYAKLLSQPQLFLNPPETEVACQTELFVEPPETPPFVAAPLGVDAETQVYPGELYDWDAEVTSLLEVLVGKNIQEALAEVLEEEELAALQDQQRQLAELRAAQLLREEQRQAEMVERDSDAAAILTKHYLAETLPSVLEGLKEAGYVLDDVTVDGEEGLMTWLMAEVSSEMNHMVNSKDILTDIVREILETRAEIYRVMSEEEGKELDLEDSDGEGEGEGEEEGNRQLPEQET